MFNKMSGFGVRVLLARCRIWVLCLAGLSPILCQAQVIDQFHNKPDIGIAAFSAGGLAQSFKQRAGSVAGAGIYVFGGDGFPAPVDIALWDGLPTAAGTQLAFGTGAANGDGWVDVFWTPVRVTAGSTYYLVFGGGANRGIAGDDANGYADGQVFANNFAAFPDLDFAFRTYAAAVPELGTLPALLAGLLVILPIAVRGRRGAEG